MNSGSSLLRDFFFDGFEVGYFEEEFPEHKGKYRYMPYRGHGHYELQQALRKSPGQVCHYLNNGIEHSFTVQSCPEYGVLEILGPLRTEIIYKPEHAARALEILERLMPHVEDRDEYKELVAILAEPLRWKEAHAHFSKIRKNITLPSEEYGNDTLDSAFVYIAEGAAKTAFNCSNSSAPFDNDSFHRLLRFEDRFIEKLDSIRDRDGRTVFLISGVRFDEKSNAFLIDRVSSNASPELVTLLAELEDMVEGNSFAYVDEVQDQIDAFDLVAHLRDWGRIEVIDLFVSIRGGLSFRRGPR